MTKTIKRCSVCQKEHGTSYCTGCGVYFCTRDFISHRGALFNEMDSLVVLRKELKEDIEQAMQKDDQDSPLFGQIDHWQKLMIEKVKLVAEHTREQVSHLLNSKRVKLNKDFQKFSQELVHLKDTENYVEQDLTRLRYVIHQFNQELKELNKPNSIVLHTAHSDRIVWSQLLFAEEKSTYAGIQQRQQQVEGMMIN